MFYLEQMYFSGLFAAVLQQYTIKLKYPKPALQETFLRMSLI